MNQNYLRLAMLLLVSWANIWPGGSFASNLQEPARNPAREKAKKETCTVSGMVVKLAGSEPIKSAMVRLRKADDQNQGYVAITDGGGHFELKQVEAGRYRLEVSRSGFVTQQFGQKTPDDPGALLTLSPGENLSDRIFRLIPSAVIAGKIMDEDGQPLSGTMVSAMREVYTEGKRKLQIQSMTGTDDLGEFRLFGLSPGRYILSALYSPHQWGQGIDNFKDLGESKSDRGYVTTYYPGSPDPSKASPIAIKSGEELRSMDMLLPQVGVYKIRGRVFNGVTHHAANEVFLSLTPKNSRFVWNIDNYTNVQKDGSFELRNVLSGSYTLAAHWFDEGKAYTARQTVDVGNADIDGLTLTIAPGVAIEGHLAWEGNPSVEEQELKVMATESNDVYWGGGQTRVLANGAFTLKDISEGTYKLNVEGISQDCYVKSIRYGMSDATSEGFTVQRGADAALDVTVSSRGARIKGSVADVDGLPAAGAWVALVPEEAHRAEFRLYKSKTTDQHGNFELRGIAPGDYKLFSWEQVESQAWEDAEFLKQFDEKGEKIRVQDGDQKTQNLTAIRTKSPESAKP
jgi:protocatechuate 3,4-dioxygenase beta subunit